MDRAQGREGAPETPANCLRRRAYLGALATTGLAGVAGCLARDSNTAPSPTSGNGQVASPCAESLSTPPDQTGTSEEGGTIVWEESFPTSLRWIRPLDDTRLLVATNDGTLVALTRDTGEISWESDVGNLVSYALVEGNTVVVRGHGSGDATLYALDADSGEERWTGLTRGTGVTAGFALLDTTQELVLARDITDTFGNELPLHAVSLADGSTRWTTDVGSQGGTIIHDGTIYYNGYDGVTAFAPDGTRRWEWTLDNAGFNNHVQRTALVCDHVIVSTKTDSSGPGDEYAVHGVNIETGEGEWTVEFDAWDPGIYAYRGRLFADYVGPEAHVDRGSIVQLDPTSGDPVWTDEQPLSWSIGAYDTVVGYTEHDDHRGLTARAIPDGTVEWEQRFENYTWPESVANGRIITTRSGGESSQFEGSLVAIDAATGDQSWELEAEYGFNRGSGLTIDSGRVYAIDEPDQEDASGTIRAVAI